MKNTKTITNQEANMNNVLSVSNNNYILQIGDLVKIVKEVKFVGSSTIKVNELYVVKETWNTTSGDIVLQKKTEQYDFVMNPNYVNKVLNFISFDKQNKNTVNA
jgi:uncharacterized Zn ribbon protein